MIDDLARDLAAAKRLPEKGKFTFSWSTDKEFQNGYVSSVDPRMKLVLDAACAAPRLAAEVERLREEVATLRQFIGITNDALPTDEALRLEREKYSTLEKISARIRGQFKTYEDVCNENANLRAEYSVLNDKYITELMTARFQIEADGERIDKALELLGFTAVQLDAQVFDPEELARTRQGLSEANAALFGDEGEK